MHDDLVNLGWTEDQLSRIRTTVAEEAQRARVLAQALPLSGPEERSTVSIPSFALAVDANPTPQRLTVNSEPILPLACIAINVQLRSHEIADPSLSAALVQFRRAANIIARLEDLLVANGWDPTVVPTPPPPLVYTVSLDRKTDGLLTVPGTVPVPTKVTSDVTVVSAIVEAIGLLEQNGNGAPYAAVLGHELFQFAHVPSVAYVLPRDRVLPFLQGPLLRSSALPPDKGIVISLAGSPVEIVVASDISVRYLQTTLEPRYVFRVSERIALRVKDPTAIALLSKT
ncbi:MAG: family 1 encapsulin nanocompartment shell protein [Polyangiaceae bacterium]